MLTKEVSFRRRPDIAVLGAFAAIAVLATLVIAGACAAMQKAGAIAEDVLVDCAIPAIESEVADLLDEAGAILKRGAPDWPKQLDNLGSNSVWAGYCAVQTVLQDLTPPSPTSRALASRALASGIPEVARAEAYLTAKHVTVEHAGTGAHYRAVRAARHTGLVGPGGGCSPNDIGGCDLSRLSMGTALTFDTGNRWASTAIECTDPPTPIRWALGMGER